MEIIVLVDSYESAFDFLTPIIFNTLPNISRRNPFAASIAHSGAKCTHTHTRKRLNLNSVPGEPVQMENAKWQMNLLNFHALIHIYGEKFNRISLRLYLRALAGCVPLYRLSAPRAPRAPPGNCDHA